MASRPSLVSVAIVLSIAAAAALPSPSVAAATPKAPCWNVRGDARASAAVRPKSYCTLVPTKKSSDVNIDEPGSLTKGGNILLGFKWSTWGAKSARGRGASYRLWAEIKVKLYAPKNTCGGRYFTRARVVYVDGDRKYWPTTRYALKVC
jgi:hypothetical protein